MKVIQLKDALAMTIVRLDDELSDTASDLSDLDDGLNCLLAESLLELLRGQIHIGAIASSKEAIAYLDRLLNRTFGQVTVTRVNEIEDDPSEEDADEAA